MFKIKFLRNILLISFLIAIILPLYNIFFVYPSFITLLTKGIENEAVRVGTHLSSTLMVPGHEKLTRASIHPDFMKMTEEVTKDFRLIKLKLFSRSGEIIYSTDYEDVGTFNDKSYFHDVVTKGNTYTKIVQKGNRSLENQEVTVDVVETYVPIMEGERFRGAFEIYYDITGAKGALDKQLLESSLIQLFVAAGFFITLIFVLLKAKKSIREREKAERQVQNYKDQLQVLISRLTSLEDEERKRISEELHDNIGQYLALSKIMLSRLSGRHAGIKEDLDEVRKNIEETIKFTRSLTFELSSPILYQLGFEQALEWLTEQMQNKHGIIIELKSDARLKNFKGEISVQLYKTVRELLLNIVKHAHAGKALVSMGMDGEYINILVQDNGIGFDSAAVESASLEGNHFGLFSIRERISFFKGTIDITSEKGRGTRIHIAVPAVQGPPRAVSGHAQLYTHMLDNRNIEAV